MSGRKLASRVRGWAAMGIVQSADAYEAWLRAQLDGEIVEADLQKKHKRMRAEPFAFLRATYWRWAETILEVCSDLGNAPRALAVGDMHVENFGTWSDVEGRLVWGVNDFDEAAEMPYMLDLVRLATSAVLAEAKGMSAKPVCAALLRGYRSGLEEPEPLVLDQQHEWLRKLVVVPEEERGKFWKKMDPQANATDASPGPRYVEALKAAQPAAGLSLAFWPRTAGAGSLGRPRWVSHAMWRGAPVIREAKAVVPSGWTRKWGGSAALRCQEIADGAYRSPDPWYALKERIVIRRLSPNNRKIEIADLDRPSELVNPDMLWAMGHDLAAIHSASAERDAIAADLDGRKAKSFAADVEAAAEFVRREHKEWKKTPK